MEVEDSKVKEYNKLSESEYRDANLDVVISNNLAVFKEKATH